jgi:hypothetical protein
MDNLHTVEQYVEGSLSTKEQAAFESALKTDTTLQKAVEDERIFRRQMEHLRLRNVVKNALSQPKSSFGYKKRLFFYALLVALGLLASYVYYQKSLPKTPSVPVAQTPQKGDEDIRYGSSLNDPEVKAAVPSQLPYIGIGILVLLSILVAEGYFYYQKKQNE